MRKENLEIIEAARRLGIRLTGQQGPNCVQITGDASQFPGRLMALQQAIDAYDKASASGGVPDEVDRLKKGRSEEHTSELQSLMRISYAVFCLKNKRP